MTTRWFTGLAIPPAACDQLAALAEPIAGVRWTRPESYHLTLCFLGAVEPGVLDAFVGAVRHAGAPFELTLAGLGWFGGSKPAVLWAGASPNPDLTDLATTHRQLAGVAGAGLRLDRDPDNSSADPLPFVPHVTLARMRRPDRVALDDLVERGRSLICQPFVVDRVLLYASTPERRGGAYDIVDEFRLGPSC